MPKTSRAHGTRRRGARIPLLEGRGASELAWDAPATVVSVAGVHGGAGTTTLCLLLAHLIAAHGKHPALTVDLAGRSRGGLAVLGGAGGQSTAEGVAAIAMIHHGQLERPLGINPAGVRIIGTHPDGVAELDRSHETLVARLVAGVDAGIDDARLAELARLAVREQRSWQALRWDNTQVSAAVGRMLDQAVAHHALLAVDLGVGDSDPLVQMATARAALHVWVVPGRASALEIAQHRLPEARVDAACEEAIVVWDAGERPISSKRLSALGDRRGCAVVRLANHGGETCDWETRVENCLSGIGDLCELAR